MITANVRGTEHVERVLKQIAPKHAEALVKQTVSAIATDVLREARKNMRFTGPYSVGTMKKETKKRQKRTRMGIVQTDIVVGKRAFYWRFYEYGDGNNPRRQMFGKAILRVRPKLRRRFEDLFMEKLIRRLERTRRKGV